MNDSLNPDQIAALFEAAKAGDMPDGSQQQPTVDAATDASRRLLAADQVHRPTTSAASHAPIDDVLPRRCHPPDRRAARRQSSSRP